LELQSHHQANPQRKSIALQTGQRHKDKEAVTLGTAKVHTKQTHKGNLLHSNQAKRQRFKKLFRLELQSHHTKQTHKGKSIALAKLQAKRQRFKNCFAWNCKGTHQAKAQREIYCTPTKQRLKG